MSRASLHAAAPKLRDCVEHPENKKIKWDMCVYQSVYAHVIIEIRQLSSFTNRRFFKYDVSEYDLPPSVRAIAGLAAPCLSTASAWLGRPVFCAECDHLLRI